MERTELAERVWKFVFSKNVSGRPPIMIMEKCSTILSKDGAKVVSASAVEAEDHAEQLAVERGWDLVAVEEV
jgi:hypothetical protein